MQTPQGRSADTSEAPAAVHGQEQYMSELATNFIILDLEWNGHPEGKTGQNEAMPFEIIEIGAVKLNSAREIIGEFRSYIKPQVYPKLHYKTRELLGITYKDLKQAKSFPEVIEEFFTWCGRGYRFCTWGSMDLTEIQRNLAYYGIARYFTKPVLYYNLQQVFGKIYDEPTARTLEYAVNRLEIPQDRPFHDALDDARYTAEVFRRLDLTQVLKNFSVDYYRHPLTKAEEIYLNYEDYSEFISREYSRREELMRAHSVITLTCPICGARLTREVHWFSGNVKNYYCLGTCKKHGYVEGKLHLKRTPDMHYFAVKTSRIVTATEAGGITSRYEALSERRQAKKPLRPRAAKPLLRRAADLANKKNKT